MQQIDDGESKPRRTCLVNRDRDGDLIGIAVFVTAAELRGMGIDVDESDRVAFVLDDGEPDFVRHE